jgi:hypothetical protein
MTTNFFSPLSFVAVLDPGSGIWDKNPGSRTTGISCLDSSLGRVPACDAGDSGSIPGEGNLNVCLQLGYRDIINIMHLFFYPTTGA